MAKLEKPKTELIPQERETHLNQTGDNHKEWELYTDDPYWIKRLNKIATAYKTSAFGGKCYKLDVSQVVIKKKPKPLSDKVRKQRAQRIAVSV